MNDVTLTTECLECGNDSGWAAESKDGLCYACHSDAVDEANGTAVCMGCDQHRVVNYDGFCHRCETFDQEGA